MTSKKIIRKDNFAHMGLVTEGNRKVKLFADALEFASDYIEVTDKDAFAKDFRGYLIDKLREKAKAIGIDHFSDQKLIQFYDVPDHILNEIQTRYYQLRRIQLSEDYTEAVLPDPNVYAETPDQMERLGHVEQLLDAIKKIQANGHGVDMWAVARGLNGAIICKGGKEAVPSETYIKPRNRR